MDAILREKEREDKLQSAKRKLKSYRARQQSKSGLSAVPSSPSSKRTSVVAGTLPSSPLKKGSFGHAHRRSSSRAGSISVIMPSSAAAAANGHSSKRSSLVLNAASANANGSTSTMHNRRNSTRRHSRNISISITANAEPTIVSSATSSTRSQFPYSSSSPSLSSQLGSGSASSMAQTPSSPFQRRQSVPVQQHQHHQHSFTNSAAPATRVLSPNTSPVLQQGQQQQSAQAQVSPFMARRSSLQMPKSPSFFEAQQLQAASSSATAAAAPPAVPGAHARRPSRHTRRTSVATRRESMEIMSGVSMSFLAGGSASPDPNSAAGPGGGNYVSTTGQFLATSSEMGSRSNTANSDSSFVTAATPTPMMGISNSFANFSWPTPSGSSVNMEDRSLSTSSDEEEERKNALSALEGRLRAPSEAIELPSLDALSLPSTATRSSSSGSASGTAQNGTSRESKRASWNGNTIANIGGKGATNLGMLVEEEEEEEEEAEEGNDSLSPLPTSAATVASSAVPAAAVARSTSPLASSTGTKRQRPSSLIFPPPRSLPFGGSSSSAYSSSFGNGSKPESPLSPTGGEQTGGYSSYSSPRPSGSSTSISPASGRSTGGGPRPLSLSAASPSSVTGASDTSLKSARRLSGLRSLTLTSPEHVLNRQLGDAVSPGSAGAGTGSPLPSSTASSLRNFGKRHSVAAVGTGNTSISSSAAAADRSSISQSSRRVSTTSISSSALSSSIGPSAGTTPAKTNVNRTSYTSGASGRRFSDFTASGGANGSAASASASAQAHHHHLGFGELVMEDMSIPEVDEQDLARVDEEDEEDVHDKSSDLLNVDRPALARSTSSNASNTSGVTSDDPVILGMQLQALRSQMEHLRSENATLTTSLASSDAARSSEVSSLREELAELLETSAGIEEERESLREDVDGWRERCSGLERALREERERADDERREGLLLRDKVRKLSSRLEQQQQVGTSDGSQNGEDQALAAAQAKLIGEMRDQIFSLAAALERERLNKAGGSASSPIVSRTASPLLRALESQEDSQIAPIDCAPAASASKAAAAAAPSVGRHHNESAASSTASSYNFSSFSGSTYSVGNATEDTSIASADECDSIFGGKSPSSPAFSSTYSSYASSSVGQGASNGISIHGTSMPLRRDDSAAAFGAIGGLQTLAEEDEEETEEEESTEEYVEEDNFYDDEDEEEDEEQEVLNAGGCSSGEEGNGGVPELVADDAQRSRTQSGSVSTDASEGMPLTPAKEQPIAPAKATHLRSHSFIRQWAFPSGSISSSYFPEEEESQQDSFWNMRLSEAPLPPLPVKEDYLSAAPFSAEISFDEDLFSNAFAKHSQTPLVGNRPPSFLLHNGPPPARSSGTARLSYTSDIGVMPDSATALSTPSTAATPSAAGSRLSLQGFSSLWGWKSSSAAATPATAPLPIMDPVAPVVPPKSAGFVHQPKIPTAVGGGTKRLLKLEPSPLSRLDFTKSCSCEHGGARIIRL